MVGQSQVEHPTAEPIRNLLLELCNSNKKVGVFLSGGVDSNSILAAYLRNGVRPIAVSFCLDGRPSTDFRCAQKTAKKIGLDFIPVFLPTALETLIGDVRTLIAQYSLRRKAEIEAFWGCWYAIREAHANGVQVIANGLTAGGLFGDDKNCSIRGHGPDGDDPTWLDEIRAEKFAKPTYGQKIAWDIASSELGLEIVSPYRDPRFREILKGHSYKSCNQPKQKQPLRDAFPEMAGWNIKPHVNLQLGDSGISALFSQLVNHPINKSGHKSVVGIYNEIARGQA
jgi:asparagine synthetase B (glutamine-hydrolysing)